MADDIQSNININIDTSQALDSIRLLRNEISAFHTQMAKMGAANAAQAANMRQNLVNSINASGQFTANITKIKTTTESFTSALEKNKLSMGEYFRYAAGASKSFGRFFQTEFETINKVARERVKDLQTQYIKLGRDANGAMQAIKVRPLTLDMTNLATKTQIAAQRQQLLNQLLKQGSTNLLNFGKNTQWAGRQLMVGFTVPLTIMGGAAAKAYQQMEEAAIKFKRVYGDMNTTNAETEKMVKNIQQLALEYTKYGIKVQETMSMAADAAAMGKTGSELLQQVASANKLAALGAVDQNKALQTTISLTDAFSISSKNLGDTINFLNSVENQTVLNIEDMTTAIPKAAPVIRQLGGDVKDLAFFMTAMKEGGINASEGANALKSGLASLINPTGKAAEMLAGFGINVKKIVESNKGDLKATVIEFAKALDTLDPLNRAQAIEQMFGKFQFARLSTLFQNITQQGTQASRVLELASTSSLELSMMAQRELKKIEQSPLFQFQKAIAEFQSQLAPVGEQFLKAITPIINFGTKLLEGFNNLNDGVKQFIVNVVGIGGVIGPVLLMSFGLIANAVANVIKGFALVKDIFNRTGKSSLSLGEQVSYMTQEQIQAAAVAASLEQVHSKLKQTFTSEAAAVDMLTKAYERSAIAQRALNVPITPRGPVRKYATGGIVRGPGTGTSDSILAMVSNGEAIIPAKSVARNPKLVQQLVSGNIPGFSEGKSSTEFAHIGDRKQIGAQSLLGIISENPSMVSKRTEQVVTGLARVFGDKFLVNIYAKLGIKTGLTSEGVSINNLLGKQGVSREEFLADFDKQGIARWKDSLKYAGLKLDDVSDELTILDKTLREEILKLESGTIRDKDVKTAFDRAAQKLGRGGVVIPAFDRLAATAGEVRVNVSQKIADAGGFIAAPGGGSKGAIDINGMKIRKGGDRFPFYRKQGFDIVGEAFSNVKNGMVSGIKAITRQKSPSKDAIDAGANIGKGAIQGIQSSVDDAKRAGTQVGTAVAAGAAQAAGVANAAAGGSAPIVISPTTQSGRKSRRVSSGSELVWDEASGTHIPKHLIGRPMYGPERPTTMQRMGFHTAGTGSKFSNLFNNISNAASSNLGNMDPRKFQYRMGGAGAIAGLGSMIPGPIGQISGMMSMPLFAASMFPEFTQKMLPKLITGFGKFIPYVGAAVVAFEVFDKAIVPMMRKNADAYAAISETLSVTQDKMDKINSFFGTDVKLGGLRSVTVVPSGSSVEKMSVAEQFRQSEDFKGTFAETANKLKSLSDAEVQRTLQLLGSDLLGQGYPKEAVSAIVDAIRIEAGKESVSINEALFSFDTPESRAAMRKNIKTVLEDVGRISKGLNVNFKNLLDNEFLFSMFGQAENIEKLKSDISSITSYMSALSGQYINGVISLKEFNIENDKLMSSISSLPNPDGLELINRLISQINPNIAKAVAGLDMLGQKTVYNMMLRGISPSGEQLNVLDYGTPEQQQKQLDYFTAVTEQADSIIAQMNSQQKSISGVNKQIKNLENQEKKINERYDARLKQLQKIKTLNDQITKSQQGQLTLAEALNRGDISAAAAAAIDLQSTDVQNTLDKQQQNLEDSKEKALKPLGDKQEALSDSIDTLSGSIDKLELTLQGLKPETVTGVMSPEELLFGTGTNPFDKDIIGAFKKIKGKKTPATGGYITGPGTGTSDSIPAMLSNGEYVIRAGAVKTIGVNTLDRLNQADKMGFADGGFVSPRVAERIRKKSKNVNSMATNDPMAPWNQGDYLKFNDPQTRRQYWAMSQPGSREIVSAGKTAGYFTPGIGSLLTAGDSATAFGKGDVGGGILNALMTPFSVYAPMLFKGIGKGLGAIGSGFNTLMGIRGGKNALRALGTSTDTDYEIGAGMIRGSMGIADKAKRLAPRLGFNIQDEALVNMLNQGFYGNMRTGVRSSTSDSLMNRIAVEREMMGIPANAGNNRTPAYGFLTTKEAVPSYYNSIMGNQGPRNFGQGSIDEFNQMLNPMSRYLERYGANTIILKPRALGKATMSFGDSLSIWDKALGLKAKTPKVNKFRSLFSSYPRLFGTLESTQKMMRTDIPGIKSPTNFPYIETHLPGGFTPKDIESIIINPSGKFAASEKEKIAAEMAERVASTRALLDSLGLKNVKVKINEGIKIGDEALEKLKAKTPAGQYLQTSMANYPLPTRGPKKTTGTPFSPISGPMHGPGLPFGFSKAPTKAEMDAVVAFIQNSPLAQIQRGDALASIVGKSTIAKGTAMFRVPTIRQNQELATKGIGDIIELGKRFTSIAGPSELQAIGMTAKGQLNTGNRELPVNTILKLIANEDIPGIMNHHVYNPNYLKNAFGKKADEYPFQSEGLLPPGLKGKIVGVSQSGDQRILEVLLSKFAKGGMVPKYYANGGYAMGTDTVPAMLTPGEFVIKKSAVDRIGPSTLNKINGYAQGGLVGDSTSTALGDSVYNSYSINVNVATDSNPEQIARAVMTQIKKIDNHRVRGSSF